MKRMQFLKLSSLPIVGLSTGIISPVSLLANSPNKTISMADYDSVEVVYIDKNGEMWIGWLLRTVAGALISSLIAKVVDKWSGECYCNGSSCTNNNAPESSYKNTQGVYGYEKTNKRFVTQNIYDNSVSFENVAVPFLNGYNTKVMNVEGPFLAGLCLATQDLRRNYPVETVRSVIVPTYEVSNGGYRFDIKPCYPTEFKTDYGSTKIEYMPSYQGLGDVKVSVKNEYDNLDWEKTFELRPS